MTVKTLLITCLVFSLVGTALTDTPKPGHVKGHVRIVSRSEVNLADGAAIPITAETYAEYPLIVLTEDGKREIARVIPDANGNYQVAIPPGDYIMDVQGRRPKGHARAKRQSFIVTADQTTRVDMEIDPGVR
jgi:hypothetical protein